MSLVHVLLRMRVLRFPPRHLCVNAVANNTLNRWLWNLP
jgi:hypothetical protein